MTTVLQARGSSAQEINLLIGVESRMDGQLFKNELERPRQNLKVISCAVSKAEFATAMTSDAPDIALVSESLQDGPLTGFEVLNELRTSSPKTRVIMLLKSDNCDLVVDAFRAGAKGVFSRTESLSNLPKCIRAVHSGQIWANSNCLDRVMEAFASAAPLRLTDVGGRRLLTKREEDVAQMVVQGFSNRETAQKLGLTEHTVSNYLFRTYEKLGISSRVELVLYSLSKPKSTF
jgi:two-component system, NarL family, nitrate/nitrite response regulator NarL